MIPQAEVAHTRHTAASDGRPHAFHTEGDHEVWNHVPEGQDFFYAPRGCTFSDGILRGPLSYYRMRRHLGDGHLGFMHFYANLRARMTELVGSQGDFITLRTNDDYYLLIVRGLDAKSETVLRLI